MINSEPLNIDQKLDDCGNTLSAWSELLDSPTANSPEKIALHSSFKKKLQNQLSLLAKLVDKQIRPNRGSAPTSNNSARTSSNSCNAAVAPPSLSSSSTLSSTSVDGRQSQPPTSIQNIIGKIHGSAPAALATAAPASANIHPHIYPSAPIIPNASGRAPSTPTIYSAAPYFPSGSIGTLSEGNPVSWMGAYNGPTSVAQTGPQPQPSSTADTNTQFAYKTMPPHFGARQMVYSAPMVSAGAGARPTMTQQSPVGVSVPPSSIEKIANIPGDFAHPPQSVPLTSPSDSSIFTGSFVHHGHGSGVHALPSIGQQQNPQSTTTATYLPTGQVSSQESQVPHQLAQLPQPHLQQTQQLSHMDLQKFFPQRQPAPKRPFEDPQGPQPEHRLWAQAPQYPMDSSLLPQVLTQPLSGIGSALVSPVVSTTTAVPHQHDNITLSHQNS